MMDIQYVVKNATVDDVVRDNIERQFTKFENFLSKPYRLSVRIEGKSNNQIKFETTIHERKTYRVECYADSVQNAIDEVENKMYRVLRKSKEKQETKYHKNDTIRNPKFKIEQNLLNGVVHRIKEFPIKPLTVEEAIEEMHNTGHNFYVFENSESEKTEVVYLRDDHSVGLIRLV